MVSMKSLQAIVMQKGLKWLVHQDAVMEVVMTLVVSVVVQYLELRKLLCSGLCLVVVEEEAVVVVVCLREGFVRQYSYMGDAQEYINVPRKLMISAKVMA